MNKTSLLPAFVLFFGLLLLESCKKPTVDPPKVDCYDPSNPNCVNYDPCYVVEEVSADFDILERLGPVPPWSDSFSIVHEVAGFNLIKFKAHQQNLKKYTWYIGSEVVTDSNEVSRIFKRNNNPPGGPWLDPGTEISITLIVESTPNLECFPDDDGIDTITKTFTVVDQCDYWVDGTFRGAWADEQGTDSFDVVFQFVPNGNTECVDLQVSNLNNNSQCSDAYGGKMFPFSSTRLTVELTIPCATPFGKGGIGHLRYNPEDNSVVIDYDYFTFSSDGTIEESKKVFKGYRLN
jgi:hypothetical protein